MTQQQNQINVSYDATQEHNGISVSGYHVDERKKIWIRAPLREDFVIESPYITGDDRFSTHEGSLFKIPYLRQVNTAYNMKNAMLVACLWLKDYQVYTDKLATTGYEFYRCLGKDNWILIPLYTEMHKYIRNHILLYHAENFDRTLIIKNIDVYHQLIDMFFDNQYKGLINHFPVLINNKMKWMVQFPPAPAMFI